MIIKELGLKNFGRFHNKEIRLEDGINLIYGENEAGKSTIHSFIQGMLFGIDKPRGKGTKEDWYGKYEPWDTPGLYNGSMEFVIGENEYYMERNFNRFQKQVLLLDKKTGRELPADTESLREFFGGLTESNYRNTISISQLKGKTEKELAGNLRNYIANLSLTKTEVDVNQAISFLKAKKKQLEANMFTGEIKELEELIKENERIEIQIQEWNKGYEEKTKELEAIEHYEHYGKQQEKQEELERKLDSFEKELEEMEIAYVNPVPLKISLDKLLEINQQLEGTDKEIIYADRQKKDIEDRYKKQRKYILFPLLLLLAGVLFFSQNIPLFGSVSIILFLIGEGGTIFFLKQGRKRMEQIQKEYNRLMERHSKLQESRKNIIASQKASNEIELHQRYKATFYWEGEYKHKEALRKECYRELEILKEELKATNERKDINAVKTIDRAYTDKDVTHLSQAASNIYGSQSTYRTILSEIHRIEWELDRHQNNTEELFWNKARKTELEQKQQALEVERQGIDTAIDSIEAIALDIHDNFGQELNRLISESMYHITSGKYKDIKADDKLSIKVEKGSGFADLEHCSVGTIEQLYLSLRLAIGDIMFQGMAMPIFLDDSFAYYDDERIKQTLKRIYEDRKGQILLFTCHKREEILLRELSIPFHFVHL